MIKRRDNGHWEPPGGVLEMAETIEQGVVREVEEETGIVVRVVRLSGVYKNMQEGVISLVFRCEPTGGVAKPTDESSSVDWLMPEEAAARMLPAYSVRMQDALGEAVRVRSHDGINLIP